MNKNIDYNKFFSDLNISNHFKVEEDLGGGFVRLKISEAERRQALQDINSIEDIVLECLRNCRDAGSKNIFIATKKIAEKKRILYIIDDGCGIPEKFHNLIFQSRVTSKLENAVKDAYGFHGRGMALFSIKLNVENVRIMFSGLNRGTCIFIEADTEKISEKKDQSIMPAIVKNDVGLTLEGGTNNIVKLIMDFSLQNPEINIFYGSMTQVISTMIDTSLQQNKEKINYGASADDLQKNLQNINEMDEFENIARTTRIPVTSFPSLAANYTVLGEILKKYFHMNISERGVQRIFYGEITPLCSYRNIFKNYISQNSSKKTLNLKTKKKSAPVKNKPETKDLILHDEVNLSNRFKDDEIRYIIDILKKEINDKGAKYFLKIENDIDIKKSNNTIQLTIFLKQKN